MSEGSRVRSFGASPLNLAGEKPLMSLDAVIVQGTLRPDGTLELDEKPPLTPGRVQVTLQPVTLTDQPLAEARENVGPSPEWKLEVQQATSGDGPNAGDWSDKLNERRIELIDKDIQGNITTEERSELAELQRKAVAYRDRVAPLPIEGARRLHRQLLEVKRQREGS